MTNMNIDNSPANGLVAEVKSGKVNYTGSSEEISKKETKGTSELGKDAFLQLLVCQMKYQDPLDPSDNTEYISQLATFSQLEQLQNLNGEYEKSQAFSIVGKHVVLAVTDSNGKTTYPEGTVENVNVSSKKITLTVNGAIYNYDQLQRVESDEYYKTKNNPTIPDRVDFSFNADSPENLYFTVNFGSNEQKASDVMVVFDNMAVDPSLVSVKDNTITVSKDALALLPNGTYQPTIIFNNDDMTQVQGQVVINVYNSKAGIETEEQTETVEA